MTDRTKENEQARADQPASRQDRLWAVAFPASSLIGGLVTFIAGGLGVFLGPFIVLMMVQYFGVKGIDRLGIDAINFSLTLAVVNWVAMMITAVSGGKASTVLLMSLVLTGIVWLVCNVKAMISLLRGGSYRYPFSFRVFS